jgi:hypothetical protein
MNIKCKHALLLLMIFITVHVVAQTPCPTCYSDKSPLSGHGVQQGDPFQRRVINVYVGEGWDSAAIKQKITDAVNCASSDWNDARDFNGQATPYYVQLTTTLSEADILVERGLDQNGGANNQIYDYPNTVHIDTAPQYFDDQDLCGLLKHEFGHSLLLDNEFGCSSIMNGSYVGGDRITPNVTQNDVFRVNQQFYTPGLCTAQAGVHSDPPPTGGGGPQSCPDPNCNEGGYGFASDYCLYPGSGCPDGPFVPTGPCCQPYTPTPVIIDLDGSGFHLTSAADGVWFDFYSTGTKIKISWIGSGSTNRFLVLDRNGDGMINNGAELFGNFTPQPQPPTDIERNGFLALAEYDKSNNGGNGDGFISRNDSVFTSLRLWQDTNHNGISETSELHSLSESGVAKLHLDYKESKRTDQYGNRFRYRAKVRDSHDAQVGRWAWDVFLVRAN